MNKHEATQLATQLHEALGGKVLRVRPEQVNPYAGDASIGWAARVVREDGQTVDVIGSGAAGYATTDRTLGWVSFDKIVEDVLKGVPDAAPAADEVVEVPTMVERLTALAAGMAEMGRELALIRDELAMHSCSGS